jgi:hypothetical protein
MTHSVNRRLPRRRGRPARNPPRTHARRPLARAGRRPTRRRAGRGVERPRRRPLASRGARARLRHASAARGSRRTRRRPRDGLGSVTTSQTTAIPPSRRTGHESPAPGRLVGAAAPGRSSMARRRPLATERRGRDRRARSTSGTGSSRAGRLGCTSPGGGRSVRRCQRPTARQAAVSPAGIGCICVRPVARRQCVRGHRAIGPYSIGDPTAAGGREIAAPR